MLDLPPVPDDAWVRQELAAVHEQSQAAGRAALEASLDPQHRQQRQQRERDLIRPQEPQQQQSQPTPPSTPAAQSAMSGRRLRLAPDEMLEVLPQRLGRIRLDTRSGDIHAGENILPPSEISRAYVRLCSPAEAWGKEATADAIETLAVRDAFDPVAEYLQFLPADLLPMEEWQALDRCLLGTEDPVAAAFLPRYLIAAVARVFEPGCDMRRLPVLIGPQERGKTALGRILFGTAYWVEGVGCLDRDALLKAHTAWGVELAELDGVTRRSDQEHLKAFLSECVDSFRAPYARAPERHPRRFVFWGTSNAPPLRDATGSTRFVCIPIPDRMLPLDWAAANRDRIWARAVEQYRSGAQWRDYSAEERRVFGARNADFHESDPWAEKVEAYLSAAAASDQVPVTVPALLEHLDVPTDRQNAANSKRVRQIAECFGWRHRRRRNPGGDKRAGLWPPEDEAGDDDSPGRPPGHPGHPSGHPCPAQPNPSDGRPSNPMGTLGTPLGKEGNREGECRGAVAPMGVDRGAQPGQNLKNECRKGISGIQTPVHPCPPLPNICPPPPGPSYPPSEAAAHPSPAPGVRGVPSVPSPGDRLQTTAELVDAALVALAMAPHPAHLAAVADHLASAHPGAAPTRTAIAARLSDLHRAELDHDQPELFAC